MITGIGYADVGCGGHRHVISKNGALLPRGKIFSTAVWALFVYIKIDITKPTGIVYTLEVTPIYMTADEADVYQESEEAARENDLSGEWNKIKKAEEEEDLEYEQDDLEADEI